ncbi:MAG: dihydrolipoamide acetyltransferase family protein [Gammaproteobacteria bacterium]
MIEFKLPSLGADMDDGTLLEWKVAPGDRVARGQVVAVVDTSKAAVDIESWQEGTVVELVVEPGRRIPVGEVMAVLAGPGEAPEQAARQWAELRAARPAAAVPAAAASVPIPAAAPSPAAQVPAGRRAVSPAARRRAREIGVDPETLAGTGPHGAVTVEDVERAASAPAPASTTATSAPAPDRAAAMRAAIAAAMSRSKREIPHYYLAETVPMAAALAHLSALNATRGLRDRILPAVLVIKAVALGLRRYREFNGTWQGGAFRAADAVHVGVAISLRGGGLIAPALHDADRRDPGELMKALDDLIRRTRAGSLRSSELSDPTITITNLGDQGVESVHPVIYPPQVAIVGVGRIADRVLALDGQPRVLPALTMTLAADHRVSDGHRGALLLRHVRELLQHPDEL